MIFFPGKVQFGDVIQELSEVAGRRPFHAVLLVPDPADFDDVVKLATGKWNRVQFYSEGKLISDQYEKYIDLCYHACLSVCSSVLHAQNFNNGHYLQTVQPDSFVDTMLVGTTSCNHFTSFSVG